MESQNPTDPELQPIETSSFQKAANSNSQRRGLRTTKPLENVIMTKIDWKEGDLVDSRYQINSILHKDHSSYLKYVVTNFALFRNFTMTVLQPNQLSIMKELMQNLDRWKAIGPHPNIVQLVYVDQVQKIPLILTEFISAISLKDMIETRELYSDNGRTFALNIFHICFSVARALRFAHNCGLFHLNLKPSNILKTKDRQGDDINDIKIDNRVCVTDFGSPFLMVSGPNALESFKPETFEQNALFWPPFLVQFIQQQAKAKEVQGITSIYEDLTQSSKIKIDLFGFGVNLLYMLIGKIFWKSAAELEPQLIMQMIATNASKQFDQNLLAALVNVIINCLDMERGFASFDGLLANLLLIYDQTFGESPLRLDYLENLCFNKTVSDALERLIITITSDITKQNQKTYQRLQVLRKEPAKLKAEKLSPEFQVLKQKLETRIEYSNILLEWLLGKQYDYKIIESVSKNKLYLAFIYDSQRNNSKAIECYKEALKTVSDDRFIALLERQQLIAYGTRVNTKRRFYGYTKKNDIYYIKLTNNATRAFCLSRNETAMIWNLKQTELPIIIQEVDILAGDASDDGTLVILGKRDGSLVFLKQAKDSKSFERHEIKAHNSPLSIIFIFGSGKFAASVAAFSFEVLLWDAQSRSTLTTILTQSSVKALAFEKNARIMLLAESDSTNVIIFKKDEKRYAFKRQTELKGHKAHISHLKLTLDSSRKALKLL